MESMPYQQLGATQRTGQKQISKDSGQQLIQLAIVMDPLNPSATKQIFGREVNLKQEKPKGGKVFLQVQQTWQPRCHQCHSRGTKEATACMSSTNSTSKIE
eukprot:6896840-Ditylum_brightwellii.AAC.1